MATGYVVAWLDGDADSSSSSSTAAGSSGNSRLLLPLPRHDGAAVLNLEITHADPNLVASAQIPLSTDAKEGGKILLRAPAGPEYTGGARGVLEVELRVRYHQLEETPLPAPPPIAAAQSFKFIAPPSSDPAPPPPAAALAPAPAPKPTPSSAQSILPPPAAAPSPALHTPKPAPTIMPTPPPPRPSASAAAVALAASMAADYPPSRSSQISEAAVDRIIGTLSEMGAPQTPNADPKQAVELNRIITTTDIRKLCAAAKEIFLRQPMLLDIKPPTKICGDIHGQLDDLVTLFGGGLLRDPSDANYLFLGNYVDFGPKSIETICLLLAYKVKFPDNLHLLRGSHESYTENKKHGFLDDCIRLYDDVDIWKTFNECFKCLPVAALVDGKMFCVHGGLSPELINLDQIKCIPRPTNVPDVGLLRDLLWSNPAPDADMRGWNVSKSEFGNSYYVFGADVVADFLKKNSLKLICRGHEAVERGYHFFANRRQLVTIFSAPNFRGVTGKPGALMSVVPRTAAAGSSKEELSKPRHERLVYVDAALAYSFKLQVKAPPAP